MVYNPFQFIVDLTRKVNIVQNNNIIARENLELIGLHSSIELKYLFKMEKVIFGNR